MAVQNIYLSRVLDEAHRTRVEVVQVPVKFILAPFYNRASSSLKIRFPVLVALESILPVKLALRAKAPQIKHRFERIKLTNCTGRSEKNPK